MKERGYDTLVHDLSTGEGPLRERGPFDVVVAGELIEDVTDLSMLFRTAAELLTQDGEMLLTTPNPFAPQRVWVGRRGIVRENADHILLAFPTGIAEIAERHDLLLAEAFTVLDARPDSSARGLAKRALRGMRGSNWQPTGLVTGSGPATARIGTDRSWRRPRRDWFRGETFVYVIRRPATGP